MSKVKIGWSEANLLPEGAKVKLAGQFYERISSEVETPVTVTALAVECGDEQAIFCACDLCETGSALLESVRKRLAEIDGFPEEKVIISAIHTHTGPMYANSSDLKGASLDVLSKMLPENAEYKPLVNNDDDDDIFAGDAAHEYIADQIAKAAEDAWNKRSDATFSPAFGRAAVGMCRRVCYDDGSAKMWGDTNMANFTELEGGNDSGIELLFTFDDTKKPTGVVANVACPSQVLEHRSFISSDYWGKVKEILREKFGEDFYVLGLCSAAGDQCPRDMIRWVEPETPINDPNIVRETVVEHRADPSMFDLAGCVLTGKRIANEILFAYDAISEYVSDTTLEHKAFLMDVPLRRVTISERDEAIAKIEEFAKTAESFDFKDNARLHVYAGTVARYEYQQTVDVNTIEVHVLRLGDVAFATNPYELFLNYGNQIRARSKAKQTFLIQLSCGSHGYLPTKKAEEGSHYSAYVSSGNTGHAGGDMLVRKTLTEINNMMN